MPSENQNGAVAWQAAWIVPVDREPIKNGFVCVENGSIADVSSTQPADTQIVELGNVALLPGLINAHTHLEFSDLTAPVGHPGIGFTDWVREVVAYRAASDDSSDAISRSTKSDAIRAGIQESIKCGVVAIGEIATAPFDVTAYQLDESEIELTFFLELLGRNPSNIEERMRGASQSFESIEKSSAGTAAISPHAPYSIHPDLMSAALEFAVSRAAPVAMHLAETRDELQLLSDVEGPFVQVLKDFGVWHPESHRAGSRVLDYLQQLAFAPRSLVIHGNYLSDEERNFIAERRDSMSVVFCPRTHAFFRHEPYPLQEMKEQGIHVAIGTDSRASNPDLNLMSELRFMRRNFPDLDARAILELGTLAGARALGIDNRLGSLTPGKRAAINVCRLNAETKDVEATLLDCESSVEPLRRFLKV